MATARPFAYNTGSAISGTTQVGSLAVGTPSSGFTSSPQFWNGPDEDLGYVIAQPISGNTQPTPISGVTASVGFNRTTGFTNSEFVSLANKIANQSYTGATQASSGLTSLGYWNSYSSITSTYVTSAMFRNSGTFNNFNVGGKGLIVISIGAANQVRNTPAIVLTSVTVGGQSATIAVQRQIAATIQPEQGLSAIAYVNYTGASTTPNILLSFSGGASSCGIGTYRILSNKYNTPTYSDSVSLSTGTVMSLSASSLGNGSKIIIAASFTNVSSIQSSWSSVPTPLITERYDLSDNNGAFYSSASNSTATESSSITITDTVSENVNTLGATMCAIIIE